MMGIACGHGGPAFTDPAKAGPDFQVQGEYEGELNLDGGTKKVGVQVIALGKHEFSATMFHGGLPGDGWSRGDKKSEGKGKTEGDVTIISSDKGKGTIKGDKLTCSNAAGESMGELKKIERKSPTIGAPAPAGAIVLFDGKSADAWHNGKIVEGDLLWNGVTSKQEFTDFSLHVEFRLPFMPEARGQGRGNSGVYLQNRYEMQVLDSFGLEGKYDDCGGLYTIAEEKVNMCFPPLSWQTYDADFTAARFDADGKKTSNARVTLKHNGVLVQDNLELPHATPGQIGNERITKGQTVMKGPIYLQDHGGDPVVFRNIWVVEKK
jgi:hypothetical protein